MNDSRSSRFPLKVFGRLSRISLGIGGAFGADISMSGSTGGKRGSGCFWGVPEEPWSLFGAMMGFWVIRLDGPGSSSEWNDSSVSVVDSSEDDSGARKLVFLLIDVVLVFLVDRR